MKGFRFLHKHLFNDGLLYKHCWSFGFFCHRNSFNFGAETGGSMFLEALVPTYKSTGVTTQKTTTDIFTAVRTSNLIHIIVDVVDFYALVICKRSDNLKANYKMLPINSARL
jgi:hypothetical protein